MAENKEALEQSLHQYETQLKQVSDAISSNDDSSEELELLRDNLEELIALTKENLDSLAPIDDDDPLAKEYAVFKAELGAELSNEYDPSVKVEENIQDELNCLVGSKCQAPFSEKWSDTEHYSYHNALIVNVDSSSSLDSVKVTVLFVNPTCQEMVPCQYFLDGECRFSDDQCRFSHGYVVNFADLKEYKEPDFEALNENVSVLAKDVDNVWKRGIVTAIILEKNQCCVKFESGQKQEMIIHCHDVLPLKESEESIKCDMSEKQFNKNDEFEERQAVLIEKSLLQAPPETKLGAWEEHTKSIGSKLMAKMGYVAGTGLGKYGEGRVQPVSATILPPGKSLDHCMALREAAGGDPNLFNVDKLQKKLKRKMLANCRKKKKQSTAQEQSPGDVFSFINKSLADNSNSHGSSTGKDDLLKQTSSKGLNVKELKITEEIGKKHYELMVLREKLSRHKSSTVGHNTLQKKVHHIEEEINSMRSQLLHVQREQNYRQTMKELTEF